MRPALRRGIAGVAVLGVVGSGYAAHAARADDPAYRTATATVGDVEATLGLAGAIEPAGRADLAFATSGTLADVAVEAGDEVEAGQVLGSLDATSLRAQVRQARAALADARARLESDRDGQTEAVSDSTPVDLVAYRTVAESEDPEPDPLADLAELQQAVIDAQSVVSDSLVAASDALAAQQAACTAETVGDDACAEALVAVQAAQQQVSDDQAALQAAIDALAEALAAALESVGEEEPEEPSEQPTPEEHEQPEQPPGEQPQVEQPGSPGSDGSEATTPSVSAATLAQDQAAIDQAEADLATARQELRLARVTAPFGGEVVAVEAAAGDSVASGTAVFVLVSRGTTTVEVTATSTQVQRLEVGQSARVTPTGSEKVLRGAVTQISSVPDDSSSYPVTLTLDRKDLDLATGLSASVAVVTGRASGVVTVPASAVSDGVVQVVEDGAATAARVTTGVTGATSVEIVDGVEDGDLVVLADLDEELPTGASESGFTSGGGGFPGGGPGGFPGGGSVVRPSGG